MNPSLERELHQFLVDAFSLREAALRRLISHSGSCHCISAELPTGHSSIAELVDAVIAALRARGLLLEFLDELAFDHLPRRQSEISAIKLKLQGGPLSVAPPKRHIESGFSLNIGRLSIRLNFSIFAMLLGLALGVLIGVQRDKNIPAQDDSASCMPQLRLGGSISPSNPVEAKDRNESSDEGSDSGPSAGEGLFETERQIGCSCVLGEGCGCPVYGHPQPQGDDGNRPAGAGEGLLISHRLWPTNGYSPAENYLMYQHAALRLKYLNSASMIIVIGRASSAWSDNDGLEYPAARRLTLFEQRLRCTLSEGRREHNCRTSECLSEQAQWSMTTTCAEADSIFR